MNVNCRGVDPLRYEEVVRLLLLEITRMHPLFKSAILMPIVERALDSQVLLTNMFRRQWPKYSSGRVIPYHSAKDGHLGLVTNESSKTSFVEYAQALVGLQNVIYMAKNLVTVGKNAFSSSSPPEPPVKLVGLLARQLMSMRYDSRLRKITGKSATKEDDLAMAFLIGMHLDKIIHCGL